MTNITELEKVFDLFSALVAAKVEANLRNRPASPPVKLLNIGQIAEMIGRSKSAVQHLIARGDLPAIRTGRRVQVEMREIEKWIEMNRESGKG